MDLPLRKYFYVLFNRGATHVSVGQIEWPYSEHRLVRLLRHQKQMPDAVVFVYEVPDFPDKCYISDSERSGGYVPTGETFDLNDALRIGRMLRDAQVNWLQPMTEEPTEEPEAGSDGKPG